MNSKTKHPLAEVLQWIIDGEEVEQRSSNSSKWHVLDVEENFSLFHNFEYRKKPKPKVKKWMWVVRRIGTNELTITCRHYAEAAHIDHAIYDVIQKIDPTMIEVEE